MDAVQASALLEVVCSSNGNGKTALHYAAQLRPGDDGAALCRALLERSADVDATTRRGHTALLFAAGRGHNETVRTLLEARANPRIISASGRLCYEKSYLDQATLALLMAAEETEDRPWKDYRCIKDAQEAQHVYEQASLVAHAKSLALACEAHRGQQEDGASNVAEDARAALCQGILGALRERSVDALTAAIAEASMKDRLLARAAFRLIFSSEHGAADLLCMIRACQTPRLRDAVPGRAGRRAKVVSQIFCTLLHELRNSQAANCLTAPDIIKAASPDVLLAAEVLLSSIDGWAADGPALEELWVAILAACHEDKRCFADLAWAVVGKFQQDGLHREFANCRVWILLLRWAAGLLSTEACAKAVDEVARLVRASQHSAQMLELVPDLLLPSTVKQQLAAALAPMHPQAPAMVASTPGSALDANRGAGEHPPAYQIAVEPLWIADAAGVARMQGEFDALLAETGCLGTLCVGMDTEWGDASGSAGIPSVVQLAVPGKAWVVDSLAAGSDIGALLLRLGSHRDVRLLGFAFTNDALRLAKLMPSGEAAPAAACTSCTGDFFKDAVLDVQRLAMAREPFLAAPSRLPGLRAVTEAFLGCTLDKSLQCSDWDARPLSPEQLRYAAADAAVLLDIAKAMGACGSARELERKE